MAALEQSSVQLRTGMHGQVPCKLSVISSLPSCSAMRIAKLADRSHMCCLATSHPATSTLANLAHVSDWCGAGAWQLLTGMAVPTRRFSTNCFTT